MYITAMIALDHSFEERPLVDPEGNPDYMDDVLEFVHNRLNATGIKWEHEYYWPGDYYYVNLHLPEGSVFDSDPFIQIIEELNATSIVNAKVAAFSM